MATRYQKVSRMCLVGKSSGNKCPGVIVWFPEAYTNKDNGPLCQRHAREMFGDREVDILIKRRLVPWKLKQNNVEINEQLEGMEDQWLDL